MDESEGVDDFVTADVVVTDEVEVALPEVLPVETPVGERELVGETVTIDVRDWDATLVPVDDGEPDAVTRPLDDAPGVMVTAADGDVLEVDEADGEDDREFVPVAEGEPESFGLRLFDAVELGLNVMLGLVEGESVKDGEFVEDALSEGAFEYEDDADGDGLPEEERETRALAVTDFDSSDDRLIEDEPESRGDADADALSRGLRVIRADLESDEVHVANVAEDDVDPEIVAETHVVGVNEVSGDFVVCGEVLADMDVVAVREERPLRDDDGVGEFDNETVCVTVTVKMGVADTHPDDVEVDDREFNAEGVAVDDTVITAEDDTVFVMKEVGLELVELLGV